MTLLTIKGEEPFVISSRRNTRNVGAFVDHYPASVSSRGILSPNTFAVRLVRQLDLPLYRVIVFIFTQTLTETNECNYNKHTDSIFSSNSVLLAGVDAVYRRRTI